MLEIYAIPVSLYCAKLRILLRHKGLAWQEQPPPGGYGSDDYKAIVPSGNLPALRDGDLVLADGEAMAEYLNEKYPDPAMLPEDIGQRAKVRELSRFHDTRLEPALRKLFPNLHLKPDSRDQALNVAQAAEINTRLVQLEVMLSAGQRMQDLSLADCGFAITFTWIDALVPVLDLDINWPEGVTDWRQTIETFPAVADELVDYRPRLTNWLAAL
jgi:glutathione S-transferase